MDDHAEALWRMAQAAGERCRDRTKYEWQINLALWTAMATATAWLLTHREGFHQSVTVAHVGTLIVGIIVVCYVLVWRLQLEKANFNDRLKAIYYSNRFVLKLGAVPPSVVEAMTPKWAEDEHDKTLGVNREGAPKFCRCCLLVLRLKYKRWSPWFGILVTVLLSVALILALYFARAATAAAAPPSSRWHENADTIWERCLYKGLQLYYQGEYQSAFEMIQSAVRSEKPGPEIHRCLALMRHAYAQTRGQHLTVSEWKTSVAEDLGRLEALKEPSDADLVILATLKYAHVCHAGSILTSEPFLDKLIDPARKSPWRDWAYWEKARVVASKAWASTRIAWGSVEFVQDDIRRIGCLDDHPDETLRARAAQAFLKENPDSYMGRAMRTDLYYWRLFEARRALARFAKNEWYVGDRGNDVFPLTDDQLKHIASARASLSALARLFPESSEKLGQAESRLDELLWFSRPSPKRTIVKYLRTVLEIRGKDAIPPDVHQWLSSVPVVKEPEYEVYSP